MQKLELTGKKDKRCVFMDVRTNRFTPVFPNLIHKNCHAPSIGTEVPCFSSHWLHAGDRRKSNGDERTSVGGCQEGMGTARRHLGGAWQVEAESVRCVFFRLAVQGDAGELADHHIKQRNKENRQHCGGEHAAEHPGTDGVSGAIGRGGVVKFDFYRVAGVDSEDGLEIRRSSHRMVIPAASIPEMAQILGNLMKSAEQGAKKPEDGDPDGS